MTYDFKPMQEERYDVVTVSFETRIVHGIAACHVKLKEAQQVKYDLRRDLSYRYFLVLVPTGSLSKGQKFEKAGKRNHGMTTYRRRQADLVCIRCESPQLETRLYCATCLQIENARLNRHKKR